MPILIVEDKSKYRKFTIKLQLTQHCSVQHNTAQYNTTLHSAALSSVVLCCAARLCPQCGGRTVEASRPPEAGSSASQESGAGRPGGGVYRRRRGSTSHGLWGFHMAGVHILLRLSVYRVSLSSAFSAVVL